MSDGWAARYLGIPFEDGGRTWAGLDCWGLCLLVYREQLGITLPDLGFAYEATSDIEHIAGIIGQYLPELSPVGGEPRDFDFVFMHRLRESPPHHVGLYVTPERVLHVAKGIESECPRFARPVFGFRVEGFYRLRAVGQAAA